MKIIKRFVCAALAAAMTAASLPVFAASNGDGAYNVENGILISSTDMSTDGVVELKNKDVQYDSADSKKGTTVFTDNGEKSTKAVIDIFGGSYAYEGVIDYAGSGKDKRGLTIPINITTETNYYAYVLATSAKVASMWTDNSSATTAAGTVGAKSVGFSVAGSKASVYAFDCGILTTGKHTLTFDGPKSDWLADICAVAVYPTDSKDFMLPYQNEELSFEERAADLVSRMTTEEKIRQLGYNVPAIDRLGVHGYYYWREAAHGVARQGKATSFPASLAISNSWDPEMYKREAEVIAIEARAKNPQYDLNYWSPTVNMSRDPRWGRNEESLGEDTYLTTKLGSAFVEGMQKGDDPNYIKTIATVKHFLANNCEGERQVAASEMTEAELRNYYARAFQNIVQNADPGAMMSSYNATTVTRNGEKLWDYIAQPANKTILTDYLRRSWGFTGFVTGDCGAVADLNGNAFKRALFKDDPRPLSDIPQSETVALSIQAGNEMDCGNVTTAYASDAVANGKLSDDDLDLAVYRVFLQRFKTGEFDSDAPYRNYTSADLETDESVALAEEAAEKSIVLLENREKDSEKLLPLNKNLKIALVGEMASEAYIGDYSGEPVNKVSPYDGLKEIFGAANITMPGHAKDTDVIMDINSLAFVNNKGQETPIDFTASGVEVTGATLNSGKLTNVTPALRVKVPNVDFRSVVTVKAGVTLKDGSAGGTIKIGYDSPTLVAANIDTDNLSGGLASGDYTGADGGYNENGKDLYITISTHSDFSVEKCADELNAADVIIAYASTMAGNAKDSQGLVADGKESNDRTTIELPERDRGNVEKLCKQYGDKTVVFMQTVGEIDVREFKDKCRALLWTSYNGQMQGLAMAKVLSGDVNPSGKLSTTWYNPEDLKIMKVGGTSEDSYDTNGTTKISWKRHDYTITRKYDTEGRLTWPGRTYMYYGGEPQYPFGYGLSYTDYTYSDLTVANNTVAGGDKFDVTLNITNGGNGASDDDKTCVEIVAAYNNGVLSGIKSINKAFHVKDIPAQINNTDEEKTFYWDSLEGMKPVTAPAEESDGEGEISAVDGTEIVQVYLSKKDSNGTDLPLRQLVGFARADVKAGETKEVTIEVDTNTLARWSETQLKDYIPEGEYTLYAGKNADDRAVTADITITGQPAKKIKTVYAVPTGITVTGAYDKTTNRTAAIKTVKPQLSVVMTDETDGLSAAAITYTSSDNDIAAVGANGIVKAGTKEGAALITASVTINGETKTVSFPVVTKLQKAISSEIRQEYLTKLDTEYAKYSEDDYRTDFWETLTGIYTDAKSAIENEVDEAKLQSIFDEAAAEMAAIRDKLKDGEKAYTVTVTPGWYKDAKITVVYNGDEESPSGTLVVEINGTPAEYNCTADMTKDFAQTVTVENYDTEVKAYVKADNGDMLSDEVSENVVKPPKTVTYDLSEPKYDRLAALASGEELAKENGIGGYGDFNRVTGVNYNPTYNGETYHLTGGFQGGKASFTKTNIYFDPFECYSKARITAFFDSSAEDRKLKIAQYDGTKDGIFLGEMGGAGSKNIQTLTVTTEDLSKPIYIMPQNKESVYMIIVEYDYDES